MSFRIREETERRIKGESRNALNFQTVSGEIKEIKTAKENGKQKSRMVIYSVTSGKYTKGEPGKG